MQNFGEAVTFLVGGFHTTGNCEYVFLCHLWSFSGSRLVTVRIHILELSFTTLQFENVVNMILVIAADCL